MSASLFGFGSATPFTTVPYVTVKDYPYSAAGDGVTDDTVAIQTCITANPGKIVVFPPGNYLITASLQILARITLDFCGNLGVLVLGTQNMNGITIGDGTTPTRNATFGTKIIAPAFVPKSGVAQFTTGWCIYRNFVAFVDVIAPQIYGLVDGVRKLWGAVRDSRAIECRTPSIQAQEMHGQSIYTDGTGTGANASIDCRYDFALIFNCDNDAIYWGAFTESPYALSPTVYSLAAGAACLHINSSLFNFFVTEPDFEIDNATGIGVDVEQGARLILKAGWVGGNIAGSLPVGIRVRAAANSCVIDTTMTAARVLFEGTNNILQGGDYSGDLSTAGNFITISGNNNVVSDTCTIRQWVGSGIAFSGTPTGLKLGGRFNNNTTDIASVGGWAALNGPIIGKCQTDKTRTGYAAAATVSVPITLGTVQITGTTNIDTIPPSGVDSMLTIQATGSTVNLVATGNLRPRAAPAAVPNGNVIHFKCDGTNWLEVGRNF